MKMRVGIVGGGVSGAVAAFTLREKYNLDIALYERTSEIGGRAFIPVLFGDREIFADTHPIFFHANIHSKTAELTESLAIATRMIKGRLPSSFTDEDFEWGEGKSGSRFVNGVHFFSLRFRKLLREIARFRHIAGELRARNGGAILFEDFLTEHQFSEDFLNKFLQPVLSETGTDRSVFAEMPTNLLLRSLCPSAVTPKTKIGDTVVVSGGLNTLMRPIRERLRPVTRLNTSAEKIVRVGETIFIHDSQGGTEAFDRLIFACNPAEILYALGAGASPEEVAALAGLRHKTVTSYLHCDHDFLNVEKQSRLERNYLTAQGFSCVSYHIGKFCEPAEPSPPPLYITVSPIFPLREDRIFAAIQEERPVFSKEMLKLRNRLILSQGFKNTYYCVANAGLDRIEDRIAAGEKTARDLMKVA